MCATTLTRRLLCYWSVKLAHLPAIVQCMFILCGTFGFNWSKLKLIDRTYWKQGVPGWHAFFWLGVAATCCNLYLGAKPRICNQTYLKVVFIIVYSLTGNAWASFRIHHCIHIVHILSTCVLNLSLVYYLQNGLFRNTFIWMHCLLFWRKATTNASLTETLVAAGAKLLPRERRVEHPSPQLCCTWGTYSLARMEIIAAC